MSGKALLILVIGFTAIFLTLGFFWESLTSRSTENAYSYYRSTIAHTIAVSGANIALSEVLRDSNWVSDISNKDFDNGKMTVTITSLGPEYRTLTSVGDFMGVQQTVKVKLMRDSKLKAEYAWFIPATSTGSVPNRPWITGDTVWGAFHSNQFLNVDGNPVFFGKVTTLKGWKDPTTGTPSNPQFLGGYEEGVDVAWSKTVVDFAAQEQAALAGQAAGGACNFDKNLWLTFNADGTATYRTGASSAKDDSSKYSAPVTLTLSQMAPTGIIFVKGADVFLSGTLKGEVTVVVKGGSGGGNGNVYLTGDTQYSVDPMIPNGAGGFMANPDSKDMLGIVADNNLIIATSQVSGGKANNVDNPNIHIDAAILCVQGGMQVQNLGAFPADKPLGSIYLQGSMTAGKEEVVAQFSGNTITAGYNRNVIFDSRFSFSQPQYFPLSWYYRIVSWLE